MIYVRMIFGAALVFACWVAIAAIIQATRPVTEALTMHAQAKATAPRPIYSSIPIMDVPVAPERHQGNRVAVVRFEGHEGIATQCGVAKPPLVLIACAGKVKGVPTIAVPNPCLLPGDFYARLLCHELGHLNGWSGAHEL